MSPNAASLAAASLLLAAGLTCAPQALAKSTDRNQTTNVAADRSDCTVTDNGPCVLTGNVEISQGSLEIRAARADIRRGSGGISSARLTGSPVRMKQDLENGGTMNATANQIDYDLQADTVVFTGAAQLQQPGQGSIAGERIVYNMRTGQVQGGGEGGGRVRMQFEPRGKTPAPARQGGN